MRRTLQRKGTAFRYFREFVSAAGLRGKGVRVAADLVAASKDKAGANDLTMLVSRNAIDRTLRTFVQSLAKEHSRSTVRAYTCDLLKFRQCLRKKTGWQDVSNQLISDFIDEQIAAGLNANSAARLLSTIRSLFRWLRQNGYALGNPTLGLRVQRAQKHSPVPSVKDLAVMASATPPSSFSALRAALIFELLYRCGLGVSEVSALDISSVDLSQRRLMVRGRRDRKRYLDLQESTAKVLTGYLPARRDMTSSNFGPLVTNWRGGRLTERSIARIIEHLASSGRVPKGTHPYTLRQAFASHGLRGGKDIQGIRHDLGVTGASALLKIGETV